MKKIFNRVFFRTMMADFGFRNPDYLRQYEFPAYFQYRIGEYETGYTLCFRRQPWLGLYKNEIFNKMGEYSGYDVTKYLEYHYSANADKREFLRFLRYEVTERLKRRHLRKGGDYHLNLETALAWVEAQEEAMAPVAPEGEDAASREVPPRQKALDDAGEELAALLESKFDAVTQSFAGRISVSNEQHLDRVVQLFVLLQQVKSPGSPGEPLFRSFTAVDLAALLRQFEAFRDKKLNTLQKKVGEMEWIVRKDEKQMTKMQRALQDFFYVTGGKNV